MSWLLPAILLPPLIAALVIGALLLSGGLRERNDERFTARLAQAAIAVSVVSSIVLALSHGADLVRWAPYFDWLRSGELRLDLGLVGGGMHTAVALVFGLLFLVVFRFSSSYMHAEAGFHRFYFFLLLLAFAMYLLVLSSTALLSFVAWELAGISSWCLIAYNYRRAQAAANGTRVFIVQRAGDAAFLLGLSLLVLWTGSSDWYGLRAGVALLSEAQVTALALCFAFAAFVKSAQVPFTPWILRAMEGPTPSSTLFYGAVMIHAGVFLVLLLGPVFERSSLAMAVLFVIGIVTTLAGVLATRAQTDIKGSLGWATVAQVGLMFAACGLGWWELALWHLCAHAVLRCYLFLRSPSILQYGYELPLPVREAPSPLLKAASLQQLWLDAATDWALVRPVQRLARDLTYFEVRVLDPLMGSPAPLVRRMSSLVHQEEQRIGARFDSEGFAQGTGLVSKLTVWVAAVSEWFEERFILQGIGRDMITLGRRLGQAANHFEQILQRPRYLVAFVVLTLLVAL